MKAVRVRDHQPVLESDAPEPVVRRGEAVVEIEAACVSHLDLQIARGEFSEQPPRPYVPGTDASGRVLVGDGVRPGERVWVRGGGVGVVRDGCWAERVGLPVEALHPLREDVDAVLAATFFVPCATAHSALHDVGGLTAGERVAVRGAGGAVGGVATQLALAGGAGEVIAILRSAEPPAVIPDGARVVVAAEPDELAGALAGSGIDLLIDTVGGEGLAACIPAMRPRGRIVLVGYVAGTRLELDILALLTHDVSLLPLNGLSREAAMEALADGWLDALVRHDLRLATTEYPPKRLEDALQAVGAGRSRGRVALRF